MAAKLPILKPALLVGKSVADGPNSDLSAVFTITAAPNTVIRVLKKFSNFMAGWFTFTVILRFVHVEKSLRSLIEMTIRS